jgi:amyloid beta precursor protein binding protein 1
MRSVLPLAALLWTANIPLIVVSCKGLLGSARLQVREHAIVESHPGNDRYDLYVHPEQGQHWPELKQYCESFKVFRDEADTTAATSSAASAEPSSSCVADSTAAPTADGEEHAHIPYVAILWQCVQRWVSSRGHLPRSYDEKKAFKQFIRETAWSGEEGNFDEAIEFAHRAYELPKVRMKRSVAATCVRAWG